MSGITSSKFFIPGFAAVVTLIVVLILVLGGSGGVADGSVAAVKGEQITMKRYNQLAKLVAGQAQPNTKSPVIPDPPNYTKCIANKKLTDKKKNDAALKKSCVQEFTAANQQIMKSLLEQQWYELEAEDRGIKVTDQEVKQRFIPIKQQTFPKEADYKKFLASTGQTEADILDLIKVQIIQQKIQEQVGKVATVSDKNIADEYAKNKSKYGQPATRDISVVFARKKSDADAAKAALDSGDSWKAVAKKYSEDPASKQAGGKLTGVTESQFEKSLSKQIFAAGKGSIQGPVKTQFGYYIFEVDKITVAKQQTLAQAKAAIKQELQGTRQQTAVQAFQKEFGKKWRKKTKCADLYATEQCKNGPEPKEITMATGAAPAG